MQNQRKEYPSAICVGELIVGKDFLESSQVCRLHSGFRPGLVELGGSEYASTAPGPHQRLAAGAIKIW